MGRTSRLEVHPRVRVHPVEKARGLLSIDIERAAGVRASLEAHFSFATAKLNFQAGREGDSLSRFYVINLSGSVLACPLFFRVVTQPPDAWILRMLGDFRDWCFKVVAVFCVEVMGVEQCVVVEHYHIFAVDTHARRQTVR